LNLIGAFINTDNTIIYGLGGLWLPSGTKEATVFLKSGNDLDF